MILSIFCIGAIFSKVDGFQVEGVGEPLVQGALGAAVNLTCR